MGTMNTEIITMIMDMSIMKSGIITVNTGTTMDIMVTMKITMDTTIMVIITVFIMIGITIMVATTEAMMDMMEADTEGQLKIQEIRGFLINSVLSVQDMVALSILVKSMFII